MADRIGIRGLRGTGFHGVFAHERREGQEFVVDVVLHVSTREAAATDDLTCTVDYGTVSTRVHDIIAGEPVNLIETLAERIASACLEQAGVLAVDVTVHKPQAPIPVPFDDVEVTISRSRDDG